MLPGLALRRMELLTKPPGQSAVAGWELVAVQQGQRGLAAEYGRKTVADWCEDPRHAIEMKHWLDQ